MATILTGGLISDSMTVEDVRSKLWSKDKHQQKYRALQSAVAGFSQGGGESKQLVFCVDFSEFYPLAEYDSRAVKAFTFHGSLHSDAPKELSNEQLWTQIDLAALHRLFFQTDIPTVISNSHTHEMSAVASKMRSNAQGLGKNIFADIKQQQLTLKQLDRIRSNHKNKYEQVGLHALDKEQREFMALFLPNWSIDEIRQVTQNSNSLTVLNKLANNSNIKYFSSDQDSIFSAISEKYGVKSDIGDEFWDSMSSSANQQKHESFYKELEEILLPADVKYETNARKIDAMALADMHMLNSFLDQKSIPVNFQILTRTPAMLDLQACLPPGVLNVIIRHPAIAPELYDFSDRQLYKAKEMIAKISSAIADYDKSRAVMENEHDLEDLDKRLSETLKNFTEFLVYSELVKDLKDSSSDTLHDLIAKSINIDGDDKAKEDAVRQVEEFLDLLGKALLDDDSVLMQDANLNHNAIELRAANARLNGRFLGLGRKIEVFCTKQTIDYRISGLEGKVNSFMLSAPTGYMSPVFHLFDADLANFFRTSKPEKPFHLARITKEQELKTVRDKLDKYEQDLKSKYVFLNPGKIKRYFMNLRGPCADQAEAVKVLFDLQIAPQNQQEVAKYHAKFELALIKYLSVLQSRAYYYAVFMQHRYAGILCSDALGLLMGATEEQSYDVDLFQNLGPWINDKRLFLCFKELFVLRQYCERAHGFELNFSPKNSSNMAEVILQQDKPFVHFSRADRDLHFANLCHRLAATGRIQEAVHNQLEDARLALARHAGYQENLLKGMMSIKSESELLSRARNLFWTSASNGRNLDKIAQSLIRSLKPQITNDSVGYSDGIWHTYTRYQISRVYQINLTTFLIFMSEKNLHQLDAFLDPFKPLLHVNILGFVQVFYWKDQLEEYLDNTSDDSPFSAKTKNVMLTFVENVQKIDDLRRQTCVFNKSESEKKMNVGNANQSDVLKQYETILCDINVCFNAFLNESSGKKYHEPSRKNSFYWTLINRLQRRVSEKMELHGIGEKSGSY